MDVSTNPKARLYRMVMPEHTCPYGLKARDFLRRKGFEIEDHALSTREETEAFKLEHDVKTTPQVFIGEERIGGYDDVRRYFGQKVAEPGSTSYRPVIAVFAMTALLALGVSYAVFGTPFTIRAAEWFIGFSMVVLAMLKLQDVEKFSSMFLNYDLLAKRWVRYSYIYPFAEGAAGVLMVAGVFTWFSAPLALFIGTIGAISVFKAVYLDKRELKCACVGGSSNVPLGFVSLTENLMMIAMAVWMLAAPMSSAHSAPAQLPHSGHVSAEAEPASTAAYRAAHQQMVEGMNLRYIGDADIDFMRGMIPPPRGGHRHGARRLRARR